MKINKNHVFHDAQVLYIFILNHIFISFDPRVKTFQICKLKIQRNSIQITKVHEAVLQLQVVEVLKYANSTSRRKLYCCQLVQILLGKLKKIGFRFLANAKFYAFPCA